MTRRLTSSGTRVVEAAVAGFHVAHADAHALGHERGEAGVGVAQDEYGVGLLGSEELLALGEHLADLVGEARTAHSHEDVGVAHAQLAEEHAGESVVVVLARVYQQVVARLIEHVDHARQADDLGTGPEQGDDFGHLRLQVARADDVRNPCLEERRELGVAHERVLPSCSRPRAPGQRPGLPARGASDATRSSPRDRRSCGWPLLPRAGSRGSSRRGGCR